MFTSTSLTKTSRSKKTNISTTPTNSIINSNNYSPILNSSISNLSNISSNITNNIDDNDNLNISQLSGIPKLIDINLPLYNNFDNPKILFQNERYKIELVSSLPDLINKELMIMNGIIIFYYYN